MVKEVIKKEVIQTTKQNDTQKDCYSIANYLKDHHSLLIAISSAIVAVFSFILNIVDYLNINAYLRFWDVEISQIKFNSSNQVYSVFTTFIFQTIILFVTWFILNTYNVYERRQVKFMYIKWKQKGINKEVKKVHGELKSSEKELSVLKKETYNMKEIEEIGEEINCIKQELNQSKKESKSMNKRLRKIKAQDWSMLFISNIFAFLVVFLGCTIFFSTLIYCDDAIRYSLVFSLLYVGINVLIQGGMNYCFARRKIKKEMDIEEIEDIVNVDLPIEKILLGKWDLVMSNKTLKSIFIQLILITMTFILSFSYAGYSKAKEQKEFQCIISPEETYVVIYNNSEDIVIKKAFIDMENIIIDLSVQKTISAKDVTLHKKRFSNVEIERP